MGSSQNYGYVFEGPQNKEYSILGSLVGFFCLGKFPHLGLYSTAAHPKALQEAPGGCSLTAFRLHIW